MLKILAIGALAAAFISPAAPDDPPTEPPPGIVVIDVVTMNGTGCTPGSTEISTGEDNSAFDVVFSGYQAGVGPGFLPTDQRRNCQLVLVVHPPQGYTYAVASVEYRGHVSIAEGATARYRTIYYLAGESPSPARIRMVTGPQDDDLHITDLTDVTALSWAPCGQPRGLNIFTEVQVSPGTSDVQHLTSSASLNRAGAFTLAWRRCR